MKKIAAVLLIAVMLFGCAFGSVSADNTTPSAGEGKATRYISNADVMPKYVPQSQVKLEDNGNGLLSPDWVKTLVIEEATVLYASDNGMFSGMGRTLDHLEEMGVNGLWLTPIFAPSQYLMFGPDTVSPVLTGKYNYEEGWQVVADFVEEAHRHNIRIFFDVVTWGVHLNAPVYDEHPEWFSGVEPTYNGWKYNWDNPELVTWFSDQLIKIIKTTNADGFRADCGINYCGYDVYRRTRQKLREDGYKICIFSEGAVDRKDVFDFEENATMDAHFRDFAGSLFTDTYNILDVVQRGIGLGTDEQALYVTGGRDRYYTATMSHHDGYDYDVQGNIIKMGYSGILSPFIPLWYIGDEWDNPHTSADGNSWLYGNTVNWGVLETHRAFYEKVKLMMRIRRAFPDIFEFYPQNHTTTNICAVETDHEDAIQAYARFANNRGVIVVPNAEDTETEWTITIPYDDMKLSKNSGYRVTDLLTGKMIVAENASDLATFTAEVKRKELGVFAIEPCKIIRDDEGNVTIEDDGEYTPGTDIIGDDVYDIDDTDPDIGNGDEPTKKKRRKMVRLIYDDTEFPLWGIILIIVGALALIGGGLTWWLILARKKKKKQEDDAPTQ